MSSLSFPPFYFQGPESEHKEELRIVSGDLKYALLDIHVDENNCGHLMPILEVHMS